MSVIIDCFRSGKKARTHSETVSPRHSKGNRVGLGRGKVVRTRKGVGGEKNKIKMKENERKK